jgi:prevent-host-death family protein
MTTTKTVTSTEFQQAVGDYGDRAKKGPLMVTRHRRPWFVIMDPDEYERLKRYDTREWLHPSDLGDEEKSDLKTAEMDPRHAHLDKLMD